MFLLACPFLGCDRTWSFYCKGKLNILKLLDKNLEFLPALQSIGSTFIQNAVLDCLLYQQTQADDLPVVSTDTSGRCKCSTL